MERLQLVHLVKYSPSVYSYYAGAQSDDDLLDYSKENQKILEVQIVVVADSAVVVVLVD